MNREYSSRLRGIGRDFRGDAQMAMIMQKVCKILRIRCRYPFAQMREKVQK